MFLLAFTLSKHLLFLHQQPDGRSKIGENAQNTARYTCKSVISFLNCKMSIYRNIPQIDKPKGSKNSIFLKNLRN